MAEHVVGVVDTLLPVPLHQVEARGEGIGSPLGEVVLRLLIVAVRDEGNTPLEVLLDLGIYLLDGPSLVVDEGVLFGSR